MAKAADFDLKAWRKSQKISAAQLAERVSCDITTIYRYESKTIIPHPDTMLLICEALGDAKRWHDWMRSTYASYKAMHPVSPEADLAEKITLFEQTARHILAVITRR